MNTGQEQPHKNKGDREKRAVRYSLRFRLLLAINIAVTVVLAGFLVWDYTAGWKMLLREKQAALQEEAQVILAAVIRQENNSNKIRQYIDDVCARRRETSSSGHHILVKIGDLEIQAQSQHRQREHLARAMEAGARSPSGLADSDEGRIAVGSASREGISVFVSEYLVNLERFVRAVIIKRVLSILLLGSILAVVVNVLIRYLGMSPLRKLVAAINNIREGTFGAQVTTEMPTELAFLAERFNSMSQALALREQERRGQMEKARRIQEHLVEPAKGNETELSFAYIYQPATDVAGDYFDVRQVGDELVLCCVADVTGHGVAAAMGAAMIKALVNSAIKHTLVPDQILAAIDDGIGEALIEGDFASMIIVIIDRHTGQLQYSSAGHEPAVIVSKDGQVRTLSATGPLLGIDGVSGWSTESTEARPGDRVVIYTDGLVEAVSPTGEMFGTERLLDLLGGSQTTSLEALREAIEQAYMAHQIQKYSRDDVTLLLLQV